MATVNGDTVQEPTLDDVQVQQKFTVYGTGQVYSGLTDLR